MGVYIKGIEMPTEGYIDVRIKCNGTASFAIGKKPYFKAVEAITVPEPHGRMIDADELHKLFIEKGKEFKGIGGAMFAAAAWCIANAPTIIPAEEGET